MRKIRIQIRNKNYEFTNTGTISSRYLTGTIAGIPCAIEKDGAWKLNGGISLELGDALKLNPDFILRDYNSIRGQRTLYGNVGKDKFIVVYKDDNEFIYCPKCGHYGCTGDSCSYRTVSRDEIPAEAVKFYSSY